MKTKGPSFILTAMPRSGTTWASAWLMDGAACYHDPLGSGFDAEAMLAHDPGQLWGLTCTSAWLLPSFLSRANCPVVGIYRSITEIDKSLVEELQLTPLNPAAPEIFLKNIAPYRLYAFADLFKEDTARQIWDFLRPDTPFNKLRWELYKECQIQPNFAACRPNTEAFRSVIRQVHKELGLPDPLAHQSNTPNTPNEESTQ